MFSACWLYWVAGLLIAVFGIVLSRAIAPRFEGKTRTMLAGAGRLTAAAGLLTIAVGVSRRVESEKNKEES